MDESRNPYNRWYRRISMSHRLTKSDTVECCRLGGLEISVSRAEGWKRGVSDSRRHVAMTDAEFEAFTSGLVEWARGVYDDPA